MKKIKGVKYKACVLIFAGGLLFLTSFSYYIKSMQKVVVEDSSYKCDMTQCNYKIILQNKSKVNQEGIMVIYVSQNKPALPFRIGFDYKEFIEVPFSVESLETKIIEGSLEGNEAMIISFDVKVN